MDKAETFPLESMAGFVESSVDVEFTAEDRKEAYETVQAMLVKHDYFRRRKKERGLIRAFLGKVTGFSPAHLSRLVSRFRDTGQMGTASRRHRFPSKYTAADVALLAEVDRAHGRLSGPATRRILQREHLHFGQPEFERLAEISASHIYNLRRRPAYRKLAAKFDATRPTKVSIGERRRPDPKGQPGWLRVDTVHQGDWDGVKGVYHINAVDAVTQWEAVGCAQKISSLYLEPILEAILHQFPFRIRGFHADNGSEYINHTVAKMLNDMLVDFTKSRACKSQDNALVEGKNGAVIRKHIGYGHIPAIHAGQIQKFYTAHFNPYLNYHRPCGFATLTTDRRGKRKRIYKPDDYRTPYEKLKSLSGAKQHLKPGIGFDQLDRIANKITDTECARKMRQAKTKLLRACKIESPVPPEDLTQDQSQ
jgi:transposase InsO family protein